MAKALAHKTRLKIIDLLAEKGEHCVCEITEQIDAHQSTVSKHLRILKDNGLVESHKEGLKIYYKLRVPCVNQFFSCIDTVLKNEMENKLESLDI